MTSSIFQHFRREEQPFIKQVDEWVLQCQTQYAPILTDFLDPRQQFIVEAVVGRDESVRYTFEGGYRDAERKRCMIYPSYFEPTAEEFEVTLFSIRYPQKFATLSHGQVLGSILGLGISRELIGDIISDGQEWQFFCTSSMSHFLQVNLTKIGKVSIHVEEANYTQLVLPIDHWTEAHTTVSSLRLDTMIANVFKISRQRSKELVESGRVKVNWTEESRPDFLIDLLDIISIRGYGRIQVKNIEGRTKKDKIKLEIGLLEKNK